MSRTAGVMTVALAHGVLGTLFVHWPVLGSAFPELFVVFLIHSATVLAACVVLGLPAHWMMSRLGWRRWWMYALAGVVAGVIVMAAIVLPDPDRPAMSAALIGRIAAAFTGLGAAGGLLFWYFVAGRASGPYTAGSGDDGPHMTG